MNRPADPFETDISRRVWAHKYAAPGERDIGASWRRVAGAVASAEPRGKRGRSETEFIDVLSGFRFLPGGRIMAGAGTDRRVTLFNCFVMGVIEDRMEGIFEALKEGALTMQQGGGVGYDFSTLRPAGHVASAGGGIASGPVSFMRVWDAMCATMLSTGSRRGAMMATLRCDHPDIEAFIDAKRDGGELRHFNLSVQVTDAFMDAVRRDADWPLVFPDTEDDGGTGAYVRRHWTGHDTPARCRVVRTIRARRLWDDIRRSAYDCAEPGVLFVDRINTENNLRGREYLSATNPCGEIPLPPYGACNLGSINVAQFVDRPFDRRARLDLGAVRQTVSVAVRFLDDVIDVSGYPLAQQAEAARQTRRIGLGMTGLADMLAMLGHEYDGEAGRNAAVTVMQTIMSAAYRASVGLARERGSFPAFDRDSYCSGPFVRRLPEDLRADIAAHGIRNSHLLAIAPAGTISLLANNFFPGGQPARPAGRRTIRDLPGKRRGLATLAPEPFRRAAAGACNRGLDQPARAPGHAGRPAAIRRQCDLEDDQLRGRLPVRRVRGPLRIRLAVRAEGIYGIPA